MSASAGTFRDKERSTIVSHYLSLIQTFFVRHFSYVTQYEAASHDKTALANRGNAILSFCSDEIQECSWQELTAATVVAKNISTPHFCHITHYFSKPIVYLHVSGFVCIGTTPPKKQRNLTYSRQNYCHPQLHIW